MKTKSYLKCVRDIALTLTIMGSPAALAVIQMGTY